MESNMCDTSVAKKFAGRDNMKGMLQTVGLHRRSVRLCSNRLTRGNVVFATKDTPQAVVKESLMLLW